MNKIRRKHLQWICDKQFDGNVAALATVLDRSRSQVAGWLADPSNEHAQPRNITEKSARELIEPALGLAPGELDIDPDTKRPALHDANARVLLDTNRIKDPELRELIERLYLAALRRRVSAAKLKALITLILDDDTEVNA